MYVEVTVLILFLRDCKGNSTNVLSKREPVAGPFRRGAAERFVSFPAAFIDLFLFLTQFLAYIYFKKYVQPPDISFRLPRASRGPKRGICFSD
jgi:hypothetical protein